MDGSSSRAVSRRDLGRWVIDVALENIESAEFLSSEEKRDILYNNAVRFLRMEDVPGAAAR